MRSTRESGPTGATDEGPATIEVLIVGAPELVTNGENGLLARMADDPALRKRMGRANRLRVPDSRADVVVEKMKKLLFAGS